MPGHFSFRESHHQIRAWGSGLICKHPPAKRSAAAIVRLQIVTPSSLCYYRNPAAIAKPHSVIQKVFIAILVPASVWAVACRCDVMASSAEKPS